MASSVMVKNPEILGGAPVFAGTRMAALEEAKALVLAQCKWSFCWMNVFRSLRRAVSYVTDVVA